MGNTAGQRHPHHEDMPPPVSNNQPDASLLVVRPAFGPGAFRHGYMRTGATPPTAGGGWYARWYTWRTTPHLAVPRQRRKRGGRSRPLLSLAGAVRVVRSRTRNPNNDSENTMGGV